MSNDKLHLAVAAGDLPQLERLLADSADVDARDDANYTPLMRSVMSAGTSHDVTLALLRAGANANAVGPATFGSRRTVVSMAITAGDPRKVEALINYRADLHYDRDGYGAMLDAVHGRSIRTDPHLLDLLRLLLAHGVATNGITPYGESALRVLSHMSRFDAVGLLLDAGADESQLQWTPLIRAVALGSVDDLLSVLDLDASLETRDYWSRTPWLVALVIGDEAKAAVLRSAGADIQAKARCGQTALMHAVYSGNPATIRYVLGTGCPIDQTDEFGGTALMEAAERGDAQAVQLLLDAGAAVDFEKIWRSAADSDIPPEIAQAIGEARGSTALNEARDVLVIRRLLQSGADPQHLSLEGRRVLLGLPEEADMRLLDVDSGQFLQGRQRRFGAGNPERMDDPFWLGMIRSGVYAYAAARRFGNVTSPGDTPTWCARRFGQSLTLLPDGRFIQIGGEHEDGYDPDFCIYNDLFVHSADGSITIYGYPEHVFPTTDFHTATLAGGTIYLIGCLGYDGTRTAGVTPVFAVDTQSLRITRVDTSGDNPGWIYRHQARLRGESEIVVSGGRCFRGQPDAFDSPLSHTHVLDLQTMRWRVED